MQVIVYSKSMNRDSRNALLWMIVFAGVIIAGISLAKIKNDYGFGLRLASSVTMLSILFTFANCNLFQSSKGGNEPWTLFIPGNTSKTQSVNGGTTYHGGGNGFATGVIPVTGMYFVHSDHLGSVTMLTDGYGNPVTGGEYGGKSYISYKPYGEILRTDSGGPDLSKFKYTGQEEDRESGLMYYKARYYDPYLARFLEADSVTNSNSLFGMNRYMYVEGNPVRFSDPTGHWKVSHITEGKWARNLGGGISLAMKAGDFRNYNFQNASGSTKGVSGGAEWASGGLSRSGNTANSLAGEEKYKGNDYKRSDFGQKVTLKMERWFYGQILNRHYADTYDKDKVVLITIGLWALKSCPQTQNKRRCEVLFSAVAWNYVKYIDDNINYSLFKNSDPIHTKNRTDDDMKEQVTIGYWSIPEKSLGVQAGGEQ